MKNEKISTSNERIRQLLDELNISQIDFCNKTGIKPSALSNYLNNNRTPRQDALSLIADTYDINPTWLMGYDVPMYYDRSVLMSHTGSDEQKPHIEYYGQKDRVKLYVLMLEAAERCTPQQLDVIIQTLKTIGATNQRRDDK